MPESRGSSAFGGFGFNALLASTPLRLQWVKAKLAAAAAKLEVDRLYQEQEAQFELQRTQRKIEFKEMQLQKEILSTKAQMQAIEEI